MSDNPFAPPESIVADPARAPGAIDLAGRGRRFVAVLIDGFVGFAIISRSWRRCLHDQLDDTIVVNR